MFQFWVVAVTFIAHESVGAVHLDPLVVGSNFVEASEDPPSSFDRDVGGLSTPDVEQFALDLRSACQRVILLASTEGARVNVGRVETDRCAYLGICRGAEGKMSSETYATHAQAPVALGHGSHMVQQRARVVIVGCKLFCVLIVIALVGAGLVIGEHGSSRLKLVVDLRHSNQIAMPGKERGKATNRSGHLEDLGIEDDAGELCAFKSRAEKIGS